LLRISIKKRSGSIVLKLEGKLAGAWVEQLERIWQARDTSEKVLVDLFDVSFVDASGKDLLAQMWQAGCDLVADTPFMKQVVHEVTGSRRGVAGRQPVSGKLARKEKGSEQSTSGDSTTGKRSRAHPIAPWQRFV